MGDICIFKRVEKKFRMTREQYDELMSLIQDQLLADEYGKSTICSVYLDTPDSLLIRNSMEAINYKEKIRLRSYGEAKETSRVFLEIKKKYDGIVYKRRIAMTLLEAMTYIGSGVIPMEYRYQNDAEVICHKQDFIQEKNQIDKQIMKEIDYSIKLYGNPQPAVMICYEREAFGILNHPQMRITFDTGIRYRTQELSPEFGIRGRLLLPKDEILMEFKTDSAMPIEFVHTLEKVGVMGTSFSKYGTAYTQIFEEKKKIMDSGIVRPKSLRCS